jgi:hypothetical protein
MKKKKNPSYVKNKIKNNQVIFKLRKALLYISKLILFCFQVEKLQRSSLLMVSSKHHTF